MSWTVNVVPMSAPRMIPSVWGKVISPAATKPISITVVAADDWMIAVTAAPAATAVSRFRGSPPGPPPGAGGGPPGRGRPRDRLEGAPAGGRHRRQRFPAGRRVVERRLGPPPVGLTELIGQAPLPLPDPELGELGHDGERDAAAGECDLGRLASPPQRARIRGHERPRP